MGICGCSSKKEFRPGQALMYKEDNSHKEEDNIHVTLHHDENIGGMERREAYSMVKLQESGGASRQVLGSKDLDQNGPGLGKRTSIVVEEEALGQRKPGSRMTMLEPTKRDEARKKSTINSTKKGPVNPEQELRELLRKKQMEEENDKKRKLAEEEIKHHLEEFNRSKQREENERKKQKESTRPSSKESEKIIEGKKEGVKEAEQKEKMDEQLPKVTRSPKAKVSIIESKPQSNREESLRAAPQRDESPVNLNVQEGRHRSQLNLPRQEIPATAESQNQNALKFHSNAGPEPMEVQVLKVSSSDLNIGEGQSPYIVNTIKEVTEPDLSIMYPRPRKESRIPSSEVKSHFASNQQLLNKRLFNIQERAESSRAENLKVLEEIRAEELVCRKVPGFGQKLINKHLMTRGDQLEEKPKTMPAKRGTAGTKDLLADESYKLKRAEFVDHREGSHVFDGEYMVFAVQGSLLKDK